MREAIVNLDSVGWNTDPVETVQAYLPANYQAEWRPELHDESDEIVIFGEDVAGWTLDGYVIPRLASGMIFATEVV